MVVLNHFQEPVNLLRSVLRVARETDLSLQKELPVHPEDIALIRSGCCFSTGRRSGRTTLASITLIEDETAERLKWNSLK